MIGAAATSPYRLDVKPRASSSDVLYSGFGVGHKWSIADMCCVGRKIHHPVDHYISTSQKRERALKEFTRPRQSKTTY